MHATRPTISKMQADGMPAVRSCDRAGHFMATSLVLREWCKSCAFGAGTRSASRFGGDIECPWGCSKRHAAQPERIGNHGHELRLIAALAIMGLSSKPKIG